jgi:hypothetical protein
MKRTDNVIGIQNLLKIDIKTWLFSQVFFSGEFSWDIRNATLQNNLKIDLKLGHTSHNFSRSLNLIFLFFDLE